MALSMRVLNEHGATGRDASHLSVAHLEFNNAI
jgi:hypothetical protein